MNNKIGRTCNFTVDDKSLLLDLVKKVQGCSRE